MRPTLYTLNRPGPGRLSIMAKPRGGDWLRDEMTALKTAGVDVLVCALTASELSESGLSAEAQEARDAGLEFVSIPIPDRDVPELGDVLPTLRMLAEQLNDGAHIATHCRFGIGRSSLLAVSLLILNGVAADTAWHQIVQSRGLSVPDTAKQREWPKNLFRYLQT